MILQIAINDEAERLLDVRAITFEFDANIMRIHLNNAAQDYIERELTVIGFPEDGIALVLIDEA